jgi:hypothetical protein
VLIGFRNRLGVFAEWIYNYVFFQRGSRLITGLTGSRVEALPMPHRQHQSMSDAA